MLENIVRKNRYLEDAPKWLQVKWRTLSSLNWFVKHYFEKLAGMGAVVRIGGEVFIDPEHMPAAAAEIYGLPERLMTLDHRTVDSR